MSTQGSADQPLKDRPPDVSATALASSIGRGRRRQSATWRSRCWSGGELFVALCLAEAQKPGLNFGATGSSCRSSWHRDCSSGNRQVSLVHAAQRAGLADGTMTFAVRGIYRHGSGAFGDTSHNGIDLRLAIASVPRMGCSSAAQARACSASTSVVGPSRTRCSMHYHTRLRSPGGRADPRWDPSADTAALRLYRGRFT